MEIQAHKDVISFRTITGKVSSIQVFQQTWSSGGGGYVDPYYGGYIQAPTIHSQNWQRVRIDVGDREISADIPGEIQLAAGDSVTLANAGSKASKKWMWVGIANGKTKTTQTFGKLEDLFCAKSFGLTFSEQASFGIWSLFGLGFIGFIFMLIVFALLALPPFGVLVALLGKSDKAALFWVSYVPIFVGSLLLMLRANRKAAKVVEQFEQVRTSSSG